MKSFHRSSEVSRQIEDSFILDHKISMSSPLKGDKATCGADIQIRYIVLDAYDFLVQFKCLQLFPLRLSHISVKAIATMLIGSMGSDGSSLLGCGAR